MHQALTVFGSSMTCTLQSHLAVSGRIFTAWATSRSVMTSTRRSRRGSVTSLPSCRYLPISCTYAWRDALMACCSETSISCVRPVGLVAQAATAAATSTASDKFLNIVPSLPDPPALAEPNHDPPR